MIESTPNSSAAPPLPRRRRTWRRVLIFPVLVYLVWCASLYCLQGRLLFPRHMVPPVTPGRLLAESGWQDSPATQTAGARPEQPTINIETGGQVTAWFLPAPQASPDRPVPLVVAFHGNAQLAEHMGWWVRQYHTMGCSVLLPEYRGYGQAAGSPSQEGIVTDAVKFYDQVVSRPDVDRARIIFHGVSLGGGVAAQVAARRKPAGLILESSFSSVAVMARRYLVPSALVTNPFRTDEVLSTLDIPVLIAHGTRDTVVPVWHAHRLRDLAKDVTYIEYECDHNDFPPPDRVEEYWGRIDVFLEKCFSARFDPAGRLGLVNDRLDAHASRTARRSELNRIPRLVTQYRRAQRSHH
ncbi:MAG: alpha/beta hydrolase [Phycisphaerae bacterium]|nr:alpha/beta hydrolase [Phycisphaerae bacterium]